MTVDCGMCQGLGIGNYGSDSKCSGCNGVGYFEFTQEEVDGKVAELKAEKEEE